jgi:hypothetical protein
MGDNVWLLWFEQEREDGEDTELLIGVYRTEETAKEAIVRLKDQAVSEITRKGSISTRRPWTKTLGPKDSRGLVPCQQTMLPKT